jgi:glycine cleavage system aminomethyltransferase T
VIDAHDADVVAWEPVWLDGKVVGWCTSGGFSHWTGQSVAQGFLPPDRIVEGLALEVEILGERRPARVHLGPALGRRRTHADLTCGRHSAAGRARCGGWPAAAPAAMR